MGPWRSAGGLSGAKSTHICTCFGVKPVAEVRALLRSTLCLFLPLSLRKQVLHASQCTKLAGWARIWPYRPALGVHLMPARPGEGFIVLFIFWHFCSLQVFADQGSPSVLSHWWAWLGHPKSVCFGMRSSGIWAKCPGHSSLYLATLVVKVSRSPRSSLVICEVICCCHC